MTFSRWPAEGVVDEWFEGRLERTYSTRFRNLTEILVDGFASDPEGEAFFFPETGERYSRAELLEEVKRLAFSLSGRLGVKKGDRVAVILPNGPEFVVTYLATAWIGAVSVVVSPRLGAEEVAFQLRDSGAVVAILDRERWERLGDACRRVESLKMMVVVGDRPEEGLAYRDVLDSGRPDAPPARVEEGELCSILYVAGTAGRLRGAMLTHRNVATNAKCLLDLVPHLFPEVRVRDDFHRLKVMICLPLYHVTALHTLLNICLLGGRAVVLSSFRAESVIDWMVREEVNFFVGVTAMFWLMRGQPSYLALREKGCLKVIYQGGAPMPRELGKILSEDFPGAVVGNGYGMTETASIAAGSFLPPGMALKKGDSIGLPTPPTLFKVVDESLNELPEGEAGELLISGAGVFKGYWRTSEGMDRALLADGDGRYWIRTGDLVVKDEEGYYTVVGRKKDMILRGGENVYSAEVENALLSHPDVLQAAVVGIPDPILGEKIKAVVVPMPGRRVNPEEMRRFCMGRIADYKVPDVVVVSREPLPTNPWGEVEKSALRDL